MQIKKHFILLYNDSKKGLNHFDMPKNQTIYNTIVLMTATL